ncbi:phosphate transporter traffic facilitator1 [Artemisia annua]|uniref:Phosphate transporter traffic facilitator1 n=1 Tax=Artemisia annua TaxID=35608 RepID=A0A2U1PZP6_ARTAN|nr:phosphate transporter traffic facilitator1 [Artemisia annua]
MEGGVAAEEGTVRCAAWIKRPENAHLVALGKSNPSSLQIFTFDRLTNSLASSPSVTFEFEEGCDPVSIAVHPSGDDIVVSTTKSCRLFQLYGQENNIKMVTKELQPLQDVGPQRCLAFSTDGSRFAAGGVDGHLRIHEWPSMRVIVDESKAHKSVNDMDFSLTDYCTLSLDSEFLATTSTDGSARIWNAADGVPVNSLTRNSDEKIELCRFSKDGTKPFLFCTVQKGTELWPVRPGFSERKIQNESEVSKNMPFTGSEKSREVTESQVKALTPQGSKDGDVCVVAVKKMEVSHWSKRLHLGFPVTSLDFCPSERVVLSTSNEWGAMITKLNVPADWKEWQIYILLLGLFLASAVLFYIFFETSDSFWNFPLGKNQPTRPKLGSFLGDAQSDDKNMWGPVDL